MTVPSRGSSFVLVAALFAACVVGACVQSPSSGHRTASYDDGYGWEESPSPCPPGKVSTVDTGVECCWPGQVWSKLQARCVGIPSCPEHLQVGGEGCCPRGKVANADTRDRCCWPGQAWSRIEERCVGLPLCPEGRVADRERCVLEAPLLATGEEGPAVVPAEAVADPAAGDVEEDTPATGGEETDQERPEERALALWVRPVPAREVAAQAMAEARRCVIRGDQHCCIRALERAPATSAVVRLLVDCYNRAGRLEQACALARRHFEVSLARQFYGARCSRFGAPPRRLSDLSLIHI